MAGLISDPVLVDDWHPVAGSDELARRHVLPVRLLGEDLVVWRGDDGRPLAWRDLCVHRGTKLSLGRVEGTAGGGVARAIDTDISAAARHSPPASTHARS